VIHPQQQFTIAEGSTKLNSDRGLVLRPRYLGSYLAMAYGLSMAVAGHLKSAMITAPAGELIFYGAVLYHARKRQRFEERKMWPALEFYAGLSLMWMVVNILRIGVWQWRPVAFGLVPVVAIGAYLVSLTWKTLAHKKREEALRSSKGPKQISLLLITTVVWVFLNFFAFPKLGIGT